MDTLCVYDIMYDAGILYLSILGQQCLETNKEKKVMESTLVAEMTCFIFYCLALLYTQPKFWNIFMYIQVVFFLFFVSKSLLFISEHGSFIVSMAKCAAIGN